MQQSSHSPSTGESFRDSMKLSRQIMHLANQPIPRFQFLQGLSDLLLRFSQCDALELQLHGEVEYQVRAVARPEPLFRFEPLGNDKLQAGVQPSGNGDVGQLVREALGSGELPASCFTPHGSFWTGDVGDVLPGRAPKGAFGMLANSGSLALIPFAVDRSNCGLLRLECARQGAFAPEMIESYEAVVETIGLAIAERRAQAALRERVKELACLYSISRVVENSEEGPDEALPRIVALLPPAWQFPDVTVARINLDGKEHATADLEQARSRQVTNIVVNGVVRGKVEVGYVEEVPHAVNGPFLLEEGHLLEAVAREIGEFIERRDAAAERSKLEDQLRHADRLATIGQLVAGVAHEINEPLGSILGFAQLARKDRGLAPGTGKDLDRIVAGCLQAREIVNKLKLFARQAPIQKARVSVPDIVTEALSLVEGRCASGGIEIERRMEKGAPFVLADPVQLKQVLVNLAVNAVQAMPHGGKLTIITRSEPNATVIEVQDTGIGMTEDIVSKIFNPFFTTKDVGEGTGLGLSVVHGIVTAHGGTIEVESEADEGAKFTVRLPPGEAGTDGSQRSEP
jgi:two-component system NtrC family sensor kinase